MSPLSATIAALTALLGAATPAPAETSTHKPPDRDVDRQPRPLRRLILERFDADGDGALSREERSGARQAWTDAIQKHGRRAARAGVRRAMLQSAVERFDGDGDGRLDRRERQAARAAVRRHRAGMGERFDRNEDGAVGPRERRHARRAQRAPEAGPGGQPQDRIRIRRRVRTADPE
jgi:hypothetical protein